MRRAAHHAEIVHFKARVDVRNDPLRLFAVAVYFRVVEYERVDMHGHRDVRIGGKVLFDAIRQIVRVHDRHARIHFDVHRRVQLVFAVGMHRQIVQPAYSVKGEHLSLDLFYDLRVGRFAQ